MMNFISCGIHNGDDATLHNTERHSPDLTPVNQFIEVILQQIAI